MCLLVLAWRLHPRYRLIVAGNRDEFHDRTAAPLQWWSDDPEILAGRDLQAGGTWMGVSRSGRFGIVTNFRQSGAPASGLRSRGHLVPDFLRSDLPPARFAETIAGSASAYAGFNLLICDQESLVYVSNVAETRGRELPPGIYGLSNHRLDEPWPKLLRTRARFAAVAAREDVAPAELLDLLADATPAEPPVSSGDGLPADLELALTAPFVRHERYGTRCSTVALLARDDRHALYEHRFDAQGVQTGATRIEFAGRSQ
jgi:uncharacterized protein with NRDE domain